MSVELVEVIYEDALCRVECTKLPGMVWSGITIESPPMNDVERAYGYSPSHAAFLSASRHLRLLDEASEPVADPDWESVFAENGPSITYIAGALWELNVNAQRKRLAELKKASAADSMTS